MILAFIYGSFEYAILAHVLLNTRPVSQHTSYHKPYHMSNPIRLRGSWAPKMVSGLELLLTAARSTNDRRTQYAQPAINGIQALGFPTYAISTAKAPFDIWGDTLRRSPTTSGRLSISQARVEV